MLIRMIAVSTLAVILIAIPVTAAAKDPHPDELGGATAVITQSPTDAALDVSLTETRHGSSDSSHHHTPTSPIGNVDVTPRPPKPTHPFDSRCVEWTSYDECLRLTPKDEEPADDDTTPATPTFTITDLASFGPAPATLTGEPDNLGVAGLPTNFTSDASVHTRNGTLFGYAIAARFTPASFTFHYGDGKTRTTNTGGTTWDELNLPQFAPTDTSHTYTERGTYTAHADTTYTAEIDLGTGWFPITGTLTIPGPAQGIRVYEAHTALVAHTCTENPTGPGC